MKFIKWVVAVYWSRRAVMASGVPMEPWQDYGPDYTAAHRKLGWLLKGVPGVQ